MRLTNKRIIAELMPIVKSELNKDYFNFTFDKRDYYNRPIKAKYIGEYPVRWIDLGDYLILEVTKPLKGKYDHATISVAIPTSSNKKPFFSYRKEYTGMGNGFYADLDENGNIIKSEWD